MHFGVVGSGSGPCTDRIRNQERSFGTKRRQLFRLSVHGNIDATDVEELSTAEHRAEKLAVVSGCVRKAGILLTRSVQDDLASSPLVVPALEEFGCPFLRFKRDDALTMR